MGYTIKIFLLLIIMPFILIANVNERPYVRDNLIAYPFNHSIVGQDKQTNIPAQKQLDTLIEEVVRILEKDQYNATFDEWNNRDIAKEYHHLNLKPSDSPYGEPVGHNFLLKNDDFGTYFYAKITLDDLRFFFPSSCKPIQKKFFERYSLPRKWEGSHVPYIAPGQHYTKQEKIAYAKKYGARFYVMPCRNGVKIRLYDLSSTGIHEPGFKQKLGEEIWVRLSIYYPKEDNEHTLNPNFLFPYPIHHRLSGQDKQTNIPAQKQLDTLIEEVVRILEKDQYNATFDEWNNRDIAKEYHHLNLKPSDSPYGESVGHNFLLKNDDFGTYFYAKIALDDLRFFFPSACKSMVNRLLKKNFLPYGTDGIAYPYAPHGRGLSKQEEIAYAKKYGARFYVMPCRNGVKIRLYDLSSTGFYEPNFKQKFGEETWVRLSIYYPKEGVDEGIIGEIK